MVLSMVDAMFVLGLTGSIGMGKSTTAKFFAEEGVPVQDADAVVHKLYEGEATAAIEAAFPGTTKDGKVDREALGKRVLGDDAAIKRLESIVHPLVALARDRFLEQAEGKGAAIAVLDIPLLFETGGDRRCDAVVVVSASADVQRERAFERAGMSEGKLAAIIAKQIPDAEKRRRADFVVDTSKGYNAARDQVRDILARVATMAKRTPK
jgi:dephospho-CoA kinase